MGAWLPLQAMTAVMWTYLNMDTRNLSFLHLNNLNMGALRLVMAQQPLHNLNLQLPLKIHPDINGLPKMPVVCGGG